MTQDLVFGGFNHSCYIVCYSLGQLLAEQLIPQVLGLGPTIESRSQLWV